MGKSDIVPGLPRPLKLYIGLVSVLGMAFLAYLGAGVEWNLSTLGETGLFILLIFVAGSFPLYARPKVRADVTTAVLFGAALLLEPGATALAGVVGIVTYTVLIRFWGERLRLPWYKYPFNAGATALYVGLTAVLFQALTTGDELLTPALVPVAVGMYLANTAMVSIAASLQLGVSPVRVWWLGTRENGPSEVAQLAFGFLGALVYRESPWTIVALFIPVAMIYIAFSRLARANTQLEETVTNLETLRGQIVRTSKLASVGAISLDLAHQIKNPLAILLGELEELQERLEDGSPSRYHADVAADAGWRIQEMTQTFSTIGQQKWVELDMCELFDEACGMAGVRNSKRVEIRRHYQQRALKVNGNSVLIREALSNIFSNAIEAVEEGQVININLSRVNGSVVGRVDDNGAGIPADVMAHLFEPFYSGKPNGQGLGLFAARHIVEMHDGSIEIKSDEGEGTTVTISLPVAADLEESLA